MKTNDTERWDGENLYAENCIRTYTGKYVNVIDPRPETIDIIDIAHSLSMQVHFIGHLPFHYSIAQHSLVVSRICPRRYALEGLLHDASEAYLSDMSRPLKAYLPGYRDIESRMMKVISESLGFQYPLPAEVKEADNRALEIEWNEIMLRRDSFYRRDMYAVEETFLANYLEETNDADNI